MKSAALSLPRPGEIVLYLRSHGVRRAIAKLFSGYLVGRERWYVTIEDLRHWVGTGAEPDGLEVRPASLADLPRMERFTARHHPHTLRAWCRGDHVFFIALADGRAVSYRCLSRAVHPSLEGTLVLGAHQMYMIDEFTDPGFRRRGITRRLAIATNPTLMAAGIREIVGVHRTDNRDTIAATRAKNIVTIGRLTCTRLGPRVFHRYEAFVPDIAPPLAPSVPRSIATTRSAGPRPEPARHAA